MDKRRMQKLAGINEGRLFQNGKFKLDRYVVGDGTRVSPNGDWCDADDVAELEQLAREMYESLKVFMDYNDQDGPLSFDTDDMWAKARKVLAKIPK